MSKSIYHSPMGGLPPQSQITMGRAVFTNAYCVIPKGVMSDIVTSNLPFWKGTRCWVLSRPLSGFSETFSHYLTELSPKGGSNQPDTEKGIEHILFVVEGDIELTSAGETKHLGEGGYAYLAPSDHWQIWNKGKDRAVFHWIRKRYEQLDGLEEPQSFVTNEQQIVPTAMPQTNGVWATTRFVEPDDMRHDMHVNIVTFQPGGVIPFAETHVMEHGLFVLQGKAVYLLNQDWVEVEAGDYMWLRAFCPQACYASGPGPFRYLLYKNVNRHMSF
ncbi:MAG: bifunctional allantoicase/(S)-ureidoglycine aminohydrolase [Cohaesibacter sp.]|nr:bifunctional allantoicase/(S)-ureidoglycine aminohydrolase [Cohaesibacter sp.]MCV6603004.1 bifunctional allantoicase/(S)-ureidoglycine aminohydrolase [Cohaesibacter sp.]